MTTDADISTYLDGTDTAAVAAAARRLDLHTYNAGGMTETEYRENIAKTDQQIRNERDEYHRQELAARPVDHYGRPHAWDAF